MSSFDPTTLARRDLASLINGLVSPRPIAWVSTVSASGERNLAPFSFFNSFSTAPPTLAFGPGSRGGINKDSLRNVRETGEFVVNVVSEDLALRANATSGDFDGSVDEWAVGGLTPVASEVIAPARVAESPASFECRVTQIVDLGSPEVPTNSIVIGTVVRIHVSDEVLDGFVVLPDAVGLVARMGEDLWCRTGDRFELARPGDADPELVRGALLAAEDRTASDAAPERS